MPYFVSNLSGGYSTSEVKTGETWIDGNPIYRKVIDFGSLPNSASKTKAHGITSLKDVISVRGIANFASGARVPLPFTSTLASSSIMLSCDASLITIQTATDRSTATAKIIIEYTKN